ncbi:heparinase II/III domain-containing protein [Chitinophaga tropicalis]|uniref:DUF4962 domain-containing protein n=1 Tax=Chitinophaga tropicalis TaxID=2683588 RepID=A0A7K1U5R4_9BACT|nr:heparinase II/III family protein [Chitinophaga tropicalis]MVT09305.1 DUF4962 domain-containing protein [Chitinophaga tropicalis]
MIYKNRSCIRLLLCCVALLHYAVLTAQSPVPHPRLFFTGQKVSRLKERIRTDTAISNNWNEVKAEADKLLTTGNAVARIDYLSLAYLMTDDKRYADKVKETLQKLCAASAWVGAEMLQRTPPWKADLGTAANCYAAAVGYDAIYHYLSKEERKTIAEGITRLGIRPAMQDWVLPATRIHTLNSMGHNWWSACVDMAGIASLAVMDEVPAAAGWAETVSQSAAEWFGFNGDELHFKPKSFDAGGGMYESVNYAAFGISEYLSFRLAYTNTFPGKKQPEIPVLKKIPEFFMHVSYPRTGPLYSLNFGDGNLQVVGDRPVKLLNALGYTDPNSLWYLSQVVKSQHREGLSVNTPLGLICEPDMSGTPGLPDLPSAALFEDMDWATMRNSWQKDATMLGIKSGITWNHSHADAGSFILFHKGEAIIKDPGNSWYGSKEYPGYFFQSQAHNVVLFNGKAQPEEQQYYGSPLRGQLGELMDAGDMKYLLANATGPTSKNFSRNFRHFIWIGKVILIVDDVKAYEPGRFEWLLHPGGDAKKVGGDISIVQNNSSVLVRPLFPETLIQSGYNHDFPDNMVLTELTAPQAKDVKQTETYYSIAYPETVKQTSFITAIILKDSVNQSSLPVIERLRGNDMQGVRIRQDGKVTDIYLNLLAEGRIMHLNSCNNLGGWDTDAYLLGLSYPENNPSAVTDYFMAYGSYIRREGKVVFSSLSKLFMITKERNKELRMVLQGQPLINAVYGIDNRPGSFILNNKAVQPVYHDKQLEIRIGK